MARSLLCGKAMQPDRYFARPVHGIPALSVRQNFFELMRRIDHGAKGASRLGERPGFDRRRVDIRQPADFGFASREVSSLRQSRDPVSGDAMVHLELRHFGPFAPYGPLPIDITEYARDASLADRQRAFEDFVNLPVARLAVLYYRAWAQLKESVCYDRTDNAFLRRLSSVVSASNHASARPHLLALRRAFPGVYVRSAASFVQLQKMLSHYFGLPIRVTPRAAGWIEPARTAGHREADIGHARLGELRLGRRFHDVQHRIEITIGPVDAPAYLDWQCDGARLAELEDIVDDFTGQRVVAAMALDIRTTPAMAMRLSQARIGRTTWLRPDVGVYRQSLRSTPRSIASTGTHSC
jgi:type VI secretion system protein ImpH